MTVLLHFCDSVTFLCDFDDYLMNLLLQKRMSNQVAEELRMGKNKKARLMSGF